MHSSTSNSNERRPRDRWGTTWLLATLLGFTMLGAWEVVWRLRGFRPCVPDDETAWIAARAKVGPNSVVFLGTSRIQTALDPRAWKVEGGSSEPVQLAIFGGSPVPLLEDLAEEESFHGLVVVDIVPRIIFDATHEREAIAIERLAAYRLALQSPARWSEMHLGMRGASRLVLRDPALSPRNVLEEVLHGGLPAPPYGPMRRDRFRPLDFSKTDAQEQFDRLYGIAASHGRPATLTEVLETIERIDLAVRKIHARGGKVVFVLFPRYGDIRTVEEQRYPRERYWDLLASRTDALLVNAEDKPTLSGFELPDGSHIDAHDTWAFTVALERIVDGRLHFAHSQEHSVQDSARAAYVPGVPRQACAGAPSGEGC